MGKTEELNNVERIQNLSDIDGAFYAPIDVNLRVTERTELPSLAWYNYDLAPKKMKITNTSHTVILSAKWMQERPFLSDGPLVGNYVFSQLHFHWGGSDEEGSEHTAEGQNFPLEMHVVHFKSSYGTQEVALREKDGLSVIIYFYKIQDQDNPSMQELIDSLTCIESPHTSVHIDLKPISDFLRPFQSDYFLYWGSVMTSTCSHQILWLISREPIGISTRQITRFRLLRGADNTAMTNNYRQVQPLNNRSVFHVSPSTLLNTTILPIPTTPCPNIIKRGPGHLISTSESTRSKSVESKPNISVNSSIRFKSMMSNKQNSSIVESIKPSISTHSSARSRDSESEQRKLSINDLRSRSIENNQPVPSMSESQTSRTVMSVQQAPSISENKGSRSGMSEQKSLPISESQRSRRVASERKSSIKETKDPQTRSSLLRSRDKVTRAPSMVKPSVSFSEKQHHPLVSTSDYPCSASSQFSDEDIRPEEAIPLKEGITETCHKATQLPSLYSNCVPVHVYQVGGLSVATQMPSVMKNVLSCFDAGSQHISLKDSEDSENELTSLSLSGKESVWPYKPIEEGTTFQSPVDINPEDVPGASFPPLLFDDHWTGTVPLLLTNNGSTAEVSVSYNHPHPTLSGGPLKGEYAFAQLHFHWGPNDNQGCEHTLQGKSVAMEVHLVHFAKQFDSLETAAHEPGGIAVVAFLLKAGTADNPEFEKLCCGLKKVEYPFTSAEIDSDALLWLKEQGKLTGYFTYPGSLTMPVLSKTVTWIVYPDPIDISHRQVNEFRQLQEGHHCINHNNRAVQPFNDRPIYFCK